MVCIRNIALAASAIVGLTSAAPAETTETQTFVPGTLNNTQEFHLEMVVTHGPKTYNGYRVEAYHTGAGLADPVFVAAPGGSALYLNDTNLQFDVGDYPFTAEAGRGDSNYARWEPVSIGTGYAGGFKDNGSYGIQGNSAEFGGWIVCEWFHGVNAPQLFQSILVFDSSPHDLPSSCANVLLLPKYF